MKQKKKTGFSYYVNTFWNFLLYLLLLILLFSFAYVIYNIFHVIMVNIFQVEQSMSELVSLGVSILCFVLPLLPQMKKIYSRFINLARQKIYKITRRRVLPHDMKTTADQATAINKALNLLQNRSSHLIAIESTPGKGKTMTAILLIDNIGNDEKLIDLFIQLQKHICYIDAGYEKKILIDFLDDINTAAKSLIIIDNVHKLSAELFHTVLQKIKAISEYSDNIKSPNLIILLYKNLPENDTLERILHEYLLKKNTDKHTPIYDLSNNLKTYVSDININTLIDSNGDILDTIRTQTSGLLRNQLLSIYAVSKDGDFLKILMQLLGDEYRIDLRTEPIIKFIAIVCILSIYLGFFKQEVMIKVWHNVIPKSNKISIKKWTKYFATNRFMLPFPLISHAYLFNEDLAREYKRRLFRIGSFENCYSKCATYIYTNELCYTNELKWLFLIACHEKDYNSIPSSKREKEFYECINGLNKNYVLTILEDEIELNPSKRELLQKELGILYIKTGKWSEARKIFKSYISHKEDEIEVWQLQLQIIEANHGVNDTDNLEMLNNIIINSEDEFITFQAKYWLAHIKMELGDFSLKPWEELQTIVRTSNWGLNNNTYAHIIHRITADTCRTFFLKGENIPNIFNSTLDFFIMYRKIPTLQEDLALEELERAHYIHYELIYQLGIWKMYKFPHDYTVSGNDSFSFNDLIKKGLELYNNSINNFLKAGIKTWRTAQIRRDELALCSSTPNFIEILSHFDEFETYAIDNHIDVFTGYIECLKGKALAIYALVEDIGINDTQYERRLAEATTALQKSEKIYINYGNIYGAIRAKFLCVLVDTLIKINGSNTPQFIIESFMQKMKRLKDEFETDNLREQQILTYLTSVDNLKIRDLQDVIIYYPIILQ